MFGLTKKNRSVHPLADEKGAKQFFKELPDHDPYKTLEELAFWLEATRDAEGLKPLRVFEIVDAIDNAARPHHRKLAHEYIAGGVRMQKFQEHRIFETIVQLWRQLGSAYEFCLAQSGSTGGRALKPHVQLIAARAVHALAEEVKWTMARYSPVDPVLWGRLGTLYAQAEGRGEASQAIALYPGLQTQTTLQREFVKPLMLAMSAPDSLLPRELELANLIVSSFAERFVMQTQPAEACKYIVDLANARAPTRLMTPAQPNPSLRYFGPGSAGGLITELIDKITLTSRIPANISLTERDEPDFVVPVLRHLALHWSSAPPSRKHERRRAIGRIQVVHGFDEVVNTMAGTNTDLDFHSKTESWTVDNVSDGGFGALIPDRAGDWLRVGALLGVKQTNEDTWGIGIVRRLSKGENAQRYAGVQIIGREVSHLRLLPAEQQAAADGHDAILLQKGADERTGQARVTLLLRPGYATRTFRVRLRGRDDDYLLVPELHDEAGEEFDIASFRIKRRGS